MDNIYEIKCFLEEAGKIEPFNLTISKPIYNPKGYDFFCKIKAPKLFNYDKIIYGADEKQAEILALDFIKMMISDKRLIDNDGEPFDFLENLTKLKNSL